MLNRIVTTKAEAQKLTDQQLLEVAATILIRARNVLLTDVEIQAFWIIREETFRRDSLQGVIQ